jgi:hypothetical protein
LRVAGDAPHVRVSRQLILRRLPVSFDCPGHGELATIALIVVSLYRGQRRFDRFWWSFDIYTVHGWIASQTVSAEYNTKSVG